MGEALMIEKMNCGLFIGIELFHGRGEDRLKFDRPRRAGLGAIRDVGGLPGDLATAPPLVSKLVVRDSQNPG